MEELAAGPSHELMVAAALVYCSYGRRETLLTVDSLLFKGRGGKPL